MAEQVGPDGDEGGAVWEKAAVSVSIVGGVLSPERAAAIRGRQGEGGGYVPVGGERYRAGALSMVMHPASPMVPTFRSDVRYFEVEPLGEGGGAPSCGWFGGGADLTPAYVYEQDCVDFHEHWAAVCGEFGDGLYDRFKAACDDYFYLPARGERRGIGGIFFDDLEALPPQANGANGRPVVDFSAAVLRNFMPSYLPIVTRRRLEPWGEAERAWQLQRRGRCGRR